MPDENKIWMDTVGAPNRGRWYGVPRQATFVSSQSSRGRSRSNDGHLMAQIDEQKDIITKVVAENEGLKSQLTDVMSKVNSLEGKLEHLFSYIPYGQPSMHAPTPSGSDSRPLSAYVPPASFPYVPPPGYYPPFPNVPPPVLSCQRPTDESEEDN